MMGDGSKEQGLAERRRSKMVSFDKLVVALPTQTPQFVQLFHLEWLRSKLKCHLDLSGLELKL